MTNTMFDSGLEGFLGGTIDWDTDIIAAVVVSSAYVPDFNLDRDFADLSGVLGTEFTPFLSKTVVDGVADAADIIFSAVPGGTDVDAIVIFLDTGVAANDLLICYIDTATGLPLTPNGGDVTVAWDAGANRIFAL